MLDILGGCWGCNNIQQFNVIKVKYLIKKLTETKQTRNVLCILSSPFNPFTLKGSPFDE